MLFVSAPYSKNGSFSTHANPLEAAVLVSKDVRLHRANLSHLSQQLGRRTPAAHLPLPQQMGKIYIIGGEAADGSGNTFSTHCIFDPSVCRPLNV
jgi:hypothetical protein